MHRTIYLTILLLLSACARQPAITPIVQPVGEGGAGARSSAYEAAECPNQGFRIPDAECGFLSVPEDRQAVGGKTIRLAVTIIHSDTGEAGTPAARKTDPLLVITGGGMRYIRGFAQYLGDALAGRDLIIMDQRGSGRSEPALECPELNAALNQGLDGPLFHADQIQQVSGALKTCRQRWTDDGVALQHYTSEASAADLEDLRVALGYPQWNLFATNSGAHLAYLLMRDYPSGVRSAVIDSSPPEDPARLVEQASNTQAALSSLFALCEADEKCKETYPEFEARFYHVVDDLNAAPQLIEVQNLSNGQRSNLHVDGEVLLRLAISGVTNWDERILSELPRLVAQLEKGQTDILKNLLGSGNNGLPLSSSGLTWFTNCTEIQPLLTEEVVTAALSRVHAALASLFRKEYEAHVAICPVFDGLRSEPARLEPVSGGAPTLAVYTGVSPVSSLGWARSATARLDQAWIVEFKSPTGGAYRGGQSCAGHILRSFIEDPTASPDASCANQAPTIRWITFQQ